MVDRIKKIQIREKLIFPEACAYNKKKIKRLILILKLFCRFPEPIFYYCSESIIKQVYMIFIKGF